MTSGMVCSVALAVALTSLCWLAVVLIVTKNYARTTRELMEANRELLRNTWATQTAATGVGPEAAGLVQASASAARMAKLESERREALRNYGDDVALGMGA